MELSFVSVGYGLCESGGSSLVPRPSVRKRDWGLGYDARVIWSL